MDLIFDKSQIIKFFKFLSTGKHFQYPQFFVSMSARNKYLTEDERLYYHLGRTEMFSRALISYKSDTDSDTYLIDKVQAILNTVDTKQTKSGKPFPAHALIMYANINTVNPFVAVNNFTKNYNDLLLEYTKALQGKKDVTDINKKFARMERTLLDNYQTSYYHKNFIDIDFDIDKDQELLRNAFYEFVNDLVGADIEFMILDTKGGYHVLLRTETIKTNYVKFIDKARDYMKGVEGFKEVEINKNNMVPVPGVLQGKYPTNIFYIPEKYDN